MKSSLLFLFFSCATFVWSQAASPSSPASQKPQTTSPSAPGSQTPPGSASPGQLKVRGPEAVAQHDPKRVVATIEGKPITAQQALAMMKPVRPEDRKRFESNLSTLVQQLYMQKEFADEAAKLSLDQQSPWKEQLEMARANILAQAYLNQLTSTSIAGAPGGDPKQYYDSHPDEFDQVKLSGIFVAFNAPGTPAANANASRTEQQARDKANDLEKKIKGGADFATVARSDSDDKRSAATGGELGTFAVGAANLPPDIKGAIAKLQAGGVSGPIRVPSGFYILKVDSRTKVPFEQARTQILDKWKNEKSQAALKQEFDKYKIQVQDPDFFNASSSPTAKTPSLQQSAPSQPSQASTKPQAQH
ncbi:MAG: peptidylprolyl isomerase [Bryobacteraceae bacterium]